MSASVNAQRSASPIVTGGIGGLGTEICRHLAEAGRQVIAVDLAARRARIQFREDVAATTARSASNRSMSATSTAAGSCFADRSRNTAAWTY
jgi:NAD(P)-dependent dehydrogenase (short-subunit alcohol dehydrogenase family)